MEESAIDRRAHPPGMRLWKWRAPDGWLHRRMDWPQAAGRGRGSLLFAGGRGDFVEKYLEAVSAWHRRGWAVASFDWRGQGKSKSDIEAANLESFDPLIDDLAALVSEWQAANPAPHVIVGHSMGAHLALRLLIERRPRLDAAVLVAPMIDVNSAPLPTWLARLVASAVTSLGFGSRPLWRRPLARAPAGSKRQKVLTSCIERYEDEHYWWDREPDFAPAPPSFGWLRAGYRSARAFTRKNLAAIDLPVLVIGAEQDRLVDPKSVRRVASLIPGAELEMFGGCAHEILRERDPVRLAALARIDAFLDEHAR
jgi:lysophospholipase